MSDRDQSRYSLDTQLAACRAFAARNGYQVIAEYRDTLTGRDPTRPGYQALKAVRDTWQAVVVWRLDRLGRDEAEYFTSIAELTRLGKAVLSATEPNGSAVVSGILAVLAAEESRRIAERVKPGLDARAAEGKWSGRIAFGMRYGKDGRPEPDPDPRCRGIDVAFELYDPDATPDHPGLADVARRLNLAGYPAPRGWRWGLGSLWRTLVNPIYAGDLRRGELLIRDNHPARIDRERFERVQSRLAQRRFNRASPGERPGIPGAGLLYCHCGERMVVGHRRADPGQWRYGMFRCPGAMFAGTCESRGISLMRLEAELRRVLAGLRLPDDDELARLVEADLVSQVREGETTVEVERLRREATRLRSVEDNLIDMRAGGEIDKAQFAGRIALVREQRRGIEADLARLSSQGRPDIAALVPALRDLAAALAVGSLGAPDLAAIVGETVERIVLRPDRSVVVEWQPGVERLLGA